MAGFAEGGRRETAVGRVLGKVSAMRSAIALRDAVLWAGASLLVPAFVVLALELPGAAIERIAAPMLGQLSAAVRLPAPSADPPGSLGGRSPVGGSRGPETEDGGDAQGPLGVNAAVGADEEATSGPSVGDSNPQPPVVEPFEGP